MTRTATYIKKEMRVAQAVIGKLEKSHQWLTTTHETLAAEGLMKVILQMKVSLHTQDVFLRDFEEHLKKIDA